MQIVGWSLISGVAGLWIGLFLKPYLGEKAKNVATHEDIDKLVTQMEATTQATKAIEARISDEVWDRQKRWELKREILLDTTKRMANLRDALVNFCTAIEIRDRFSDNDSSYQKLRNDRTEDWTRAYSNFEETVLLVQMSCSASTATAMDRLSDLCLEIGATLHKGDVSVFNASMGELLSRIDQAKREIRSELGIGSP